MSAETINGMFAETCGKFSDRTSLMSKREGKYEGITYGELYQRVKDFALGLTSMGVGKGDRVAILSNNREEWAVGDLAILSLGATDTPVYPTLLPKQIEFILKDCGAKMVLVEDEGQLAKIDEIHKNLPKLDTVIIFGQKPPSTKEHLYSYSEVMEKGKEYGEGREGFFEGAVKSVKGDDQATIIYTSGTTGLPKGTILTHHNFMSNVWAAKEAIPVDENDVLLSFLPLSHVFERMAGYYIALASGAAIAYAESIDTVGDNMVEVKPTLMVSVPRLYEKIYGRIIDAVESGSSLKKKIFYWGLKVGEEAGEKTQAGQELRGMLKFKRGIADKLVFSKLRARTGGGLRFFVSGGAPLSKEIGEFFYSAGILILEGYGLTETSPVITVNRLDDFKFGTVGKVVQGVEVKIAEDGEILTRGPHIMKGYFNNPEATAEAIDKEDWFHTGDIGLFDHDGFLRITDRKKNLIVTSGGKNIAPGPIENLLITSRYIEQVMLIGDRRNFLSALIVPGFENLEQYAGEQGISYTDRHDLIKKAEIYRLVEGEIERLSGELAPFERVKKFILLPQEFSIEGGELTPTLKIRKSVVMEKFLEQVETMYR